MLGAQHEDVGLNTDALQFFHRVLRRLRLQFAGCGQIGHVGQVYADGVAAQFPFQLTDGLEEGVTLDVAHGTANLGDNEVVVAVLAQIEHVALDFVRDMGDDLYGLAKVVAAALLFDDALVDAAGGHIVVTGGLDTREAFVVAKVKVGFLTIVCHVAFAVLVGVERARVNVDVGVELLDGDIVTTCLKKFADGRGDNTLSQRGGNASGDEDILSVSHDSKNYKCLKFIVSEACASSLCCRLGIIWGKVTYFF